MVVEGLQIFNCILLFTGSLSFSRAHGYAIKETLLSFMELVLKENINLKLTGFIRTNLDFPTPSSFTTVLPYCQTCLLPLAEKSY